MKVRKLNEVKEEPTSGGIFTGEVAIKRVFGRETGATSLNVSLVSFPAGVRNTWHTHEHDQCLWILTGRGKVASREREYTAEPGLLHTCHGEPLARLCRRGLFPHKHHRRHRTGARGRAQPL